MQIDWLTVAAQIFNFLVLVWLLRRFLYRPVLDMMAQRQKGISDRIAEAAAREQAAKRREDELAESQARFESDRGERLAALGREVRTSRQLLLAEARAEADQASARWRESVERERRAFTDALRDDLAVAITEGAGRCVAALAGSALEASTREASTLDDRAFARFLEAVKGVDPSTLRKLRSADAIEVASATLVAGDPAREARWREAIADTIGSDARLNFLHDPDLLLGAQLRASGLRVGWNAASVLEDAGVRIRERLDGLAVPGSDRSGSEPLQTEPVDG